MWGGIGRTRRHPFAGTSTRTVEAASASTHLLASKGCNGSRGEDGRKKRGRNTIEERKEHCRVTTRKRRQRRRRRPPFSISLFLSLKSRWSPSRYNESPPLSAFSFENCDSTNRVSDTLLLVLYRRRLIYFMDVYFLAHRNVLSSFRDPRSRSNIFINPFVLVSYWLTYEHLN